MKDSGIEARPPSDPVVLRLIAEAVGAQLGRETGRLEEDLAALADLLNPASPGAKIRERLAALPCVFEGRVDSVRPIVWPWVHVLPDGEAFVTLEGRAGLEVEGQDDWPAWVLLEVARAYQRIALPKALGIVDLLSGRGPLAAPAAVASVLLLLVNRSTSEARAMPGADADAEGEAATSEILAAGAQLITPGSKPSPREVSFRQGYGLSEAMRRLGPKNIATGNLVYLREGRQDRAVQFVVEELTRRKKSADEARTILNGFVQEYRSRQSVLAAAGHAFERPKDTKNVCERIVSGVERYEPK